MATLSSCFYDVMAKDQLSGSEKPQEPTPFQKQLAELNHMRALFFAKRLNMDTPEHFERYINKLPAEFDDLSQHFSVEWALIYLTEDDPVFGVVAIIEGLKKENMDQNFIDKFEMLFSEESYFEEWDHTLADPYEHDELKSHIAKLRGLMVLFAMDANFIKVCKQRFRLALAVECAWFGIDIPNSLIELLSDEEKEELSFEIADAAEMKSMKKDPDELLRVLVKEGKVDQNVLLMRKDIRGKITDSFEEAFIQDSKKMAGKELQDHCTELHRLLMKYSDPGVIIDILLKP